MVGEEGRSLTRDVRCRSRPRHFRLAGQSAEKPKSRSGSSECELSLGPHSAPLLASLPSRPDAIMSAQCSSCPLPERSLALSLPSASNGFHSCQRHARGGLEGFLSVCVPSPQRCSCVPPCSRPRLGRRAAVITDYMLLSSRSRAVTVLCG